MGTFLGVPIIRIIIYWGLYWGHIESLRAPPVHREQLCGGTHKVSCPQIPGSGVAPSVHGYSALHRQMP